MKQSSVVDLMIKALRDTVVGLAQGLSREAFTMKVDLIFHAVWPVLNSHIHTSVMWQHQLDRVQMQHC